MCSIATLPGSCTTPIIACRICIFALQAVAADAPGGLPRPSLGSMDAPADLMDLKHAFDSAAPGVEQAAPPDVAAEDMPPISPEITAAFAAPPGAGGAVDAGAAAISTPGKTSGSGTRSLAGLPATAAPQGVLFNVINAETLETAAQQVCAVPVLLRFLTSAHGAHASTCARCTG